jgi:chemotaxis protein MotB
MKSMQWMVVLVVCGVLALSTGCQPWQKKYEACMSEKENLDGLFASTQQSLQDCTSERDRMALDNASLQQQLANRTTPTPTPTDTVPPGWKPGPRGSVSVALASDVLFDSGKAIVKSSAKSKLNSIASTIKQKYAGREINVVGHSDTDPIRKSKWKDNWELSCERALAVTRYLIAQGIPAKQLAASGRSQYHPIGSSKSQNRRVEIMVFPN